MGILAWFFRTNPDKPGVYRIRNRRNGRAYIGSTIRSIRVRLQEHIEQLHEGMHHNYLLQADWDMYGSGAFAFEVMENVDDLAQVETRELHWQQRIPHGTSYVLRLAQPARRRQRRGGLQTPFFMPSNINYTDNMHPLELLYAMCWAIYDDESFVFDADTKLPILFDKGAKDAVIKASAAYRRGPKPPMAPVTRAWAIKLLALQRNVTTPTPISLPG